ncbi:MAG: UDP-N-acetylmuramate dehydrogenase [Deltaproteobacteria bacterium]|nr:UDP-N-acetylmuramate dehydrogenase [Deltaproteobacteria bacterium]
MDASQKTELFRIAGGQVRFRVPMSRHTTFRVGGDAEALCRAADLECLCRVLAFLTREGIPYLAIGKGSNLLVRDGGIRGVVILLSGKLACIEWKPDGHVLAGAGLSLADLLTGCRQTGLSGLEFLAGIPGTVGGAAVMNAGAFGNETGDLIEEMRAVDAGGHVHVYDRSQLVFSYRRLDMEAGSVIAQVGFRLTFAAPERVADRIGSYLKRRKTLQPIAEASAGSVFKNPPHDYAGRLIEQAGLKGRRVGGAMISKRHANFIVNTGGATAADILALIEAAREAVMQTTGITLELEVRVAGDPACTDPA